MVTEGKSNPSVVMAAYMQQCHNTVNNTLINPSRISQGFSYCCSSLTEKYWRNEIVGKKTRLQKKNACFKCNVPKQMFQKTDKISFILKENLHKQQNHCC